MDHGVQHLGGNDDGFAHFAAFFNHLFLNIGNLSGGDFHAKVAAGNHNAVGGAGDFVKVINALLVFDFCDNANMLSAAAIEAGANFRHIGGGADKGCGDIVKTLLHGEAQVGFILFGERGKRNGGSGNVDGLVIGKSASVFNAANDGGSIYALHLEGDKAIVHKYGASQVNILGETGISDGYLLGGSLHLVGAESEALSCLELDSAFGEGLYADFRAFGVQNDGGGKTGFRHGGAKLFQSGKLAFMAAVGEVEAGAVHAKTQQAGNGLYGVNGGTKCADNFSFTHIIHPNYFDSFPAQYTIRKA